MIYGPDTVDPITGAVKKGVALLDDQAPGWRDKIDVDSFDITSQHRCVLGQVYGEYTDGALALFGSSKYYDDEAMTEAVECGFWATGVNDEKWEALQLAWLKEFDAADRFCGLPDNQYNDEY
jgi:hypothetical protein